MKLVYLPIDIFIVVRGKNIIIFNGGCLYC